MAELVGRSLSRPPDRAVVADLVDTHHIASATQALIDMEMTLATGVPSIAGAVDLLAAMPADTWAIVTSGRRPMALARLASAGLPRPGVVVAAEDVATDKPAPEPFLAGADALGLEPRHCAVFEDAPSGIRSARAAGAKVDPAMFFHPEGERGRARRHRQQKAKAVCAKCPVVAKCREHALRFGEDFGTWGGLPEDDRDLSHRQVRRR